MSNFRDTLAIIAFHLASHLTEPICKTHEFFWRIRLVDALHPSSSALSNFARKIPLYIPLAAWSFLAIVATLPGIALRARALNIQEKPFIYLQGEAEEKTLPSNRSFSLLSWNVCCVSGGYSIRDGGLWTWPHRIDNIITKLIEIDADVICLYEIFDSQAAFYIYENLKRHGYCHFYLNIGPTATSVASGILIASKYNIENPEFFPFAENSLQGSDTKGVFAFDLESLGENFARIYSTHLQHSEEPAFPTTEELEARKIQMQLIVDQAKTVRDRCVVVTGDLNLDDAEYNTFSWHSIFQKEEGHIDKTWGGDAFCARMVGKRVSGPLNLDHTLVVDGTVSAIKTTLVPTEYDPAIFKKEALSDHAGLLSWIALLEE